jgi:hypothetical protein
MALNNQSSAKDVLVDADMAAVRAERVRANLKWRDREAERDDRVDRYPRRSARCEVSPVNDDRLLTAAEVGWDEVIAFDIVEAGQLEDAAAEDDDER